MVAFEKSFSPVSVVNRSVELSILSGRSKSSISLF